MQERKDLLKQVCSSIQLLAIHQTENGTIGFARVLVYMVRCICQLIHKCRENITLESCLLNLSYLLLVITQFHYWNKCFYKLLLLSALLVLASMDPINNTISVIASTATPLPITLLSSARATYKIPTGATLLLASGLEEHIPEYILYYTSRLLRTFFNRGARAIL